nr:unnamed protein product [Spirometra erinaceieuropaei]
MEGRMEPCVGTVVTWFVSARRWTAGDGMDLHIDIALTRPPTPSETAAYGELESLSTTTRRILRLNWQDRIPDTDVLEGKGMLSIYSMLRQMQLRWNGHLVRMYDERLPKRLFYGDVATGSRRQGGPIRRYKDTLKLLQINPTNWKEVARDRPTWRRTVKTGAAIHEANRIAAAKAKREARKSQLRPVSNAAVQPLPTCPRCQRTFRA